MDAPDSTRSATICALPRMARPTRQVRPMMRPARLRRQEMRCSVREMPARLSPPKSPTCAAVYGRTRGCVRVSRSTSSNCGHATLAPPDAHTQRLVHLMPSLCSPDCTELAG